MKSLHVFIALLFAATVVHAQSQKIEFEEYDLDNGLHVILHEDHSTPIVTVSIMYHVGSKNEKKGLKGFTHLFEHLMFEGSKNIPRGEYSEYVEKAGGTLNANTSSDRTYYYQTLPSNELELGLWLESERMLHVKIDSVGIATQKKVVLEEKKQRYDNKPYGSVMIEIMKRAYQKHPYHWTTIGREEDIKNSTDQDVKEFYETFYVPNNAVLTIAGDINKKETQKLVEKYFGGIPKGTHEMPRPEVKEPPQKKEIRDTIYDKIQLPAVIQAYHIPAIGTEDYYAVDMLSTLLSGGQSSRLYKTLVDEKQIAMQVSSYPFPREDPGLAMTFALPNVGKDPKALEEAMNNEISNVREELISEKEMQKLRNQFESDIINNNATLARRASNLSTYYTYFNNTNLINKQIKKYNEVTREDIKRVANEYFTEDNRVVLYYLPKNKANTQ